MITKYKKNIMLVAIISLLASGFLPYGINTNKEPGKNIQVSQTRLCCCDSIASSCKDCSGGCCSEGLAETDNSDKYTVTITACGGTSDEIITVSKLNYFLTPSVVVNYLHVTTLVEAATLQIKDVLIKPPYKPPKSQLLTHLT